MAIMLASKCIAAVQQYIKNARRMGISIVLTLSEIMTYKRSLL